MHGWHGRLSLTLFAVVAACGPDGSGTGGALPDPTSSGTSSNGSSSTAGPATSGTTIESETTTAHGGDTAEPTTGGSTGDDAGFNFDLGQPPDAPGIDPRCEQNLDIVFVIDVSTTMSQFIGILSAEILAVDAAVADLALLGEPHYGLAVFVDDALLLNDGAPYDDASALQADFDQWAAFAGSNQQVGGGNGNFTWTENSLDALHFAAADFDWRPIATTTRMIVHVTDDTFWDGPTNGNGVPIQYGYAETVDILQSHAVRVFSFADDIGGACGCDDVTPGWSTPYMGMAPIPMATDGGVFPINEILGAQLSLTAALDAAVEQSICTAYDPVG